MGAVKPTTTSPHNHLLAAFGLGTPGGSVLIILSWWLLTMVTDPAAAREWWEYALVAAYLSSLVWAPLLAGALTLRLAARLGWDWRSI
jgi:hypothetical protein